MIEGLLTIINHFWRHKTFYISKR